MDGNLNYKEVDLRPGVSMYNAGGNKESHLVGDTVRRVRQNHALEHATIAVLQESGVRLPLAGYSTSGGFFIFGKASTEAIYRAAHDALSRLDAGERELAISPYCGTNLVTGALLAAVLSAVLMGRRQGRFRRIRGAAMAIVGASLLSRPMGKSLQRFYTTLADVSDMAIAEVGRIWAGPYTLHNVRTTFGPR